MLFLHRREKSLANETTVETKVPQARHASRASRERDAHLTVRLLVQNDPHRRMRIHVPARRIRWT